MTAALAACQPASAPAPASREATSHSALMRDPRPLTTLLEEIASGGMSAEAATQDYLDRIEQVDDAGPTLNAVLAVNPEALARAKELDGLASGARGLLHGAPILVKDNIDTVDPLPTTAGSLALQDNVTGRDAPVIARLREAGAVILGKTNLSEWANFRDGNSSSGWSAVGGLTKNPHVLDRSACGSSSGSGAAVAAGLAAAAIGTETDGSIVCPAAANGIVGLKPTVGLVSRTHIIPISATQDTAGPMTLTVADAALLLTVMAGGDPADAATAQADAKKQNYTLALDANALQGRRIAVARFLAGYHPATDAAFEAALEELRDAGAVLVDVDDFAHRAAVGQAEWLILTAEFKAGLDAYLATAPETVKTRTLADIIAFNEATPAEMEFFGQSIFVETAGAPSLASPEYLAAKAEAKRLAGAEGIDRILLRANAVAIVAPTGGPAWAADLVTGDHFLGSSSGLPAVAGYPHITVPMGSVRGAPVGLSFIGPAWSEATLLGLAYAFEQRTQARPVPEFLPHSP